MSSPTRHTASRTTGKLRKVAGDAVPVSREVYRLQAEMCRTLGHPDRLRLIDALKDGAKSTAALRRQLKIDKVNLSRHLKALRSVGLVEAEFSGREASYRLTFREIGSTCAGIRQVLALRLGRSAALASSLGLLREG